MSAVTVVGSANMDIVFTVDRVPRPGETLLADSAARYPGGKGLNQAVAAARAGVETTFVGALGDDDNGRALKSTMVEAGMDTSLVRTDERETGQAFIVVDRSGENTIIVASGANASVAGLTEPERAAITGSTVVLMQLELPISAVLEAAQVATAAVTIVNAAPAQTLSDELLGALDVLVVNEHEATIVAGIEDLAEASQHLANTVPRLVVTLGSEGSVLYESGREVARVPARLVTPIDTTGAGDTFCGALAAALAEGRDFVSAATFATAAASLSVQKVGAVPSIPLRAAIEAVL